MDSISTPTQTMTSPSTQPESATRTVTLPKTLWERLRAESKRTGRTQAWLIKRGAELALAQSEAESVPGGPDNV